MVVQAQPDFASVIPQTASIVSLPETAEGLETRHRLMFERDTHIYLDEQLQAPEEALMRRLQNKWPQMEMLDIGVGAGRTARVFGNITRSFTGIDYSKSMIALAKKRIGEDERRRFLVCDAREMSELEGKQFDFILFSFNGIDYVGHEDRQRILQNIRRHLKPAGYFFFSTHTLDAVPFRLTLPSYDGRNLRWMAYALHRTKTWLRLKYIHRDTDLDSLKQRGWAMLTDGSHDFEAAPYYIRPETQRAQLKAAGFEIDTIYDLGGHEFRPEARRRDAWLYYLCRPQVRE